MGFADRRDAGRRLARRLLHLAGEHPLVLALPRGGVPVAAEVAGALDAPLDVFVVRKIGAPMQPELGVGAIAEDGTMVIDRELCELVGVGDLQLRAIAARERLEAERRVRRYRGDRPPPDVAGRTVIVVDDGVATGGTARAVLRALRGRGPARLVFAAPVASPEAVRVLARDADDVVAALEPEGMSAIGAWYRDFHQVSDEEVIAALEGARKRERAAPFAEDVEIPVGDAVLEGRLVVPPGARGVVLFAHGSGSSRFSRRNRFVAELLQGAGLATLLFDLLTAEEEVVDRITADLRFDIELLAHRLAAAVDWIQHEGHCRHLRIGLFGSSTGAAAALIAAAARPDAVAAVVSRGGRPDLAGDALGRVQAPTLLLVGGDDDIVLGLNRRALAELPCEKELSVIPGATHLFEEPGALERVAERAARWFEPRLVPAEEVVRP